MDAIDEALRTKKAAFGFRPRVGRVASTFVSGLRGGAGKDILDAGLAADAWSANPGAKEVVEAELSALLRAHQAGASTTTNLIGAGVQGGAGAAVGVATLGLTGAVKQLSNAVRKKRDYNAMLDVHPDLAAAREQDPKFFNVAYDSMRALNPDYASNPLVAASIMSKMIQAGPGGAGQVLAGTVRDPGTPGRMNVEIGMGPVRVRREF